MHVLEILEGVSEPARWMFRKLIENRVWDEERGAFWTNESVLYPKNLTKPEQRRVINGYKELVNAGLAIRLRNGLYLLNPDAVVTPNYAAVKVRWDSLKDNQ